MTKFDLPVDELRVPCRSCGAIRPIDDYRYFKTGDKPLFMDFCVFCEKKYGTITLYRRYNAYGTKEIIDAVFAAERKPPERRGDAEVRLLVVPNTKREPETHTELVERELARRELAKRRLIYFTTAFDERYTPGWVHQDIARRLERFIEAVERRESPRLMLFMPPRHGKSRLVSDMFPSWVMGKHPEWEIVQASYGAELAEQFSRNVRDRVRSEDYQAIFDKVKLRTDSQSIGTWRTTAGGGYQAAGAGGPITGRGFTVGIIDDPLKDAEEAASETIREKIWSWYQAVFRTRPAPGGGILLVQTRWHDADLAGKLLTQQAEQIKAGLPADEMDQWEVVEYPAIAEANEYLLTDGRIWRGELPDDVVPDSARLLREKGGALHVERYPLNELAKLKNSMIASIWSALYQQNPTPDDGEYFKKGNIKVRHLPRDWWPSCRIFITADYAIRKGQKNDFTVLAVFALDADDNLYVIAMRRGRWGTYDIAKQIVSLVETYKPEVYAGEQGQIHYAVWPVVQKMLDTKRLYLSVDDSLNPTTDKEVRARPLQARTELHRLFFSWEGAVKPDEFVETEREMLRFPNGTHDDTVDCLAWGAHLAHTLSLPQRPRVQKIKSWRDDLHNAVDGDSHMCA